MNKRVLVVGAGIAGLTAAHWLLESDWEVVVIEKAPALRRGEFVIDFAGTGWDVAMRMGLIDQIEARRSPLTELRFEDGEGQCKARLPMEDFVRAMGVEGKHASLNRRDLTDLLYESVASRAQLRFGTTLSKIVERTQDVQVQFTGQENPEHFDLVIGADGLHSSVRALAFGPEQDYARYLGYQVAAFRAQSATQEAPGVMRLARLPSKQAGIVNLDNGDALGLFVYADPVGAHVPRSQRKSLLAETFRDMGGIVPGVIEAIKEDTAVYLDSVTQIEMPRWHQGRVVLIGDAAYCLTLVSGQGASMAMGGAYFLTQALTQEEDLAKAFSRYEKSLRPFVEDLQAKTRRLAGSFVPSSRVGLWVSELGMRALGVSWIRNLLSKKMSVRSLLDAGS